MSERLPPLNALKAFEAATRHLSVTKAALELNVSAGAISHQIRNLEAHLGVQLFRLSLLVLFTLYRVRQAEEAAVAASAVAS